MYQFLMDGIKNNILFNTQKIEVIKSIKNSLYSCKEAGYHLIFLEQAVRLVIQIQHNDIIELSAILYLFILLYTASISYRCTIYSLCY